jgi:CheY-like chemotaxis protein
MKPFKLFQRPHSMVCIDDDVSFIEVLAMSAPPTWDVHYFTKTKNCITHLSNHAQMMQRDLNQFKQVFQTPSDGKGVIASTLQYWRQNPQRWGLCELGFFDYSMPKMNGLELLVQVPDWRGTRILLTGFADEKIAIKAFNEGLIQHFLKKHEEPLVNTLMQAVDQLSPYTHNTQHSLCQNQLNDTQASLLKHSLTSDALNLFVKTHWIEYVVLSDPFGILGLDAQGKLSWLQLERQCDIDDLKAIAASEPWDTATHEALASGAVLSNSLLRQALNDGIAPAIAPVAEFGDEGLIGAMFPFTAPNALNSPVCYADWCKANKSLLIRDLD